MGYRSEVIFGVKKDSRDKMDKVLEKHDLQNTFRWYEKTYDFTEFDKLNNHKVKQTEYWIIWVGDFLKWYDEFEEAIVFTNLVPLNPLLKGVYKNYVPDGTYDYLKFEKGIWRRYKMIFDDRKKNSTNLRKL